MQEMENLLENWFQTRIYLIVKINNMHNEFRNFPLWFNFYPISAYSEICLQGEIYLPRKKIYLYLEKATYWRQFKLVLEMQSM